MSGSATLEPVVDLGGHGDFALTVAPELGRGTVSGFVAAAYHDARLAFDGVEIDQSDVAKTRRELRALLDDRG